MSKRAAVWIDHRKAVIVVAIDHDLVTTHILSNVEKQLRPDGGVRSKTQYGPQESPPDDMREAVFMGHLDVYFDRVVSCLHGMQGIWILGPGEAKRELKKRLERGGLGARITSVETSDKMTDGQLVAMLRESYLAPTESGGQIVSFRPRGL
jgi:hypothetical protein